MSNIEKETAELFSKEMSDIGFHLDFTIESLNVQIDKILRSKTLCFGGKLKKNWKNQANLEAYVGETLVRIYNGKWAGQFNADNPAGNFYLSSVKFNTYELYPSHFLRYRISNGEESEGTFYKYIQKIIPKCSKRE